MDIEPFESYFDKTIWKGADNVPSYQQLKDMENACMSKLYELKNQDYQQYKILFAKYGEKAVSRITFCNSKIAKGLNDVDERKVKSLLSSYNRFLKNLKAIDRGLYENCLRSSIQKGKSASRTIKKNAEKSEPVAEETPVRVPHYTNLNIDEQQAATLYDKLVTERYLEDRSKNDFVYYYTGKGYQARQQLKWIGNYIVLSNMTKFLSPNNVVSWQTLEQVYEGVNTHAMNARLHDGWKKESTKEKYRRLLEGLLPWVEIVIE